MGQAQSSQYCRSGSASRRSGSSRKHDWQRNSSGRRGTIRAGPSARSSPSRLVLLELVLVVLERGAGGPLLRAARRAAPRRRRGGAPRRGRRRPPRRPPPRSSRSAVAVSSVTTGTGTSTWASSISSSSSSMSSRLVVDRRRRRRGRPRRGLRRPARVRRLRILRRSSGLRAIDRVGTRRGRGRQRRGAEYNTAPAWQVATQTRSGCRGYSRDACPARSRGAVGAADAEVEGGPRRPLGPLAGPGCRAARVIAAFSTWSPEPPCPSLSRCLTPAAE